MGKFGESFLSCSLYNNIITNTVTEISLLDALEALI